MQQHKLIVHKVRQYIVYIIDKSNNKTFNNGDNEPYLVICIIDPSIYGNFNVICNTTL